MAVAVWGGHRAPRGSGAEHRTPCVPVPRTGVVAAAVWEEGEMLQFSKKARGGGFVARERHEDIVDVACSHMHGEQVVRRQPGRAR